MVGSILRGLVAGAALLSLAGISAAVGIFQVSDVAAAGTIVTLLLLLGLVLFDSSWETAEDYGDDPADAVPLTEAKPVLPRVAEADPTAA
jgi:hypothetical protein